jgi:hypothetical protein
MDDLKGITAEGAAQRRTGRVLFTLAVFQGERTIF